MVFFHIHIKLQKEGERWRLTKQTTFNAAGVIRGFISATVTPTTQTHFAPSDTELSGVLLSVEQVGPGVPASGRDLDGQDIRDDRN